jgi:hypothetical protein
MFKQKMTLIALCILAAGSLEAGDDRAGSGIRNRMDMNSAGIVYRMSGKECLRGVAVGVAAIMIGAYIIYRALYQYQYQNQ